MLAAVGLRLRRWWVVHDCGRCVAVGLRLWWWWVVHDCGNPNQPCARGVAGLRSCPVTPTSSPLRSAPCHAAQTSVHERRREARMCGSEGKLGRVGGAQSASLPSPLKLAPPRTSLDVRKHTPMSFHRALRASAPPVHASPWGPPPSPPHLRPASAPTGPQKK